jgi:hypothetical protein
MIKKYMGLLLLIFTVLGMSMPAYAIETESKIFSKENLELERVETIEVFDQEASWVDEFSNTLTSSKSYPNKHESDWLSDRIGYYDYKVKIDFALNSRGKFRKCNAYISKKMNFLAYINDYFTVMCEIKNAVYTLTEDKITVKFDMVYSYIPDWYGNGWTESVEYVLNLSDI